MITGSPLERGLFPGVMGNTQDLYSVRTFARSENHRNRRSSFNPSEHSFHFRPVNAAPRSFSGGEKEITTRRSGLHLDGDVL